MRAHYDGILGGVDEDGGELAGLVHAEGGGEEGLLVWSEGADGFGGLLLGIVGELRGGRREGLSCVLGRRRLVGAGLCALASELRWLA